MVHEVRDEVGHETKVPHMCLGREGDRGEVYVMENDQVGSQGCPGRPVRCSLAMPWRSTDVQVRCGVAGSLAIVADMNKRKGQVDVKQANNIQ